MIPFLVSAIIAATAGTFPPADCTDSMAKRLEAQLTPALDARAQSSMFSGVVLVTCRGRPVYSAAYGTANRARQIRNTAATRFNLGSMNKMWTAVAIAQLVDQGKVDVDAPVGKYLPELSNAALRDRVLVRHLLTHTSGLGSYFKRGYLRDRVALSKASDLLRFFVDDSLDFAPGERVQYSNAGFAVLGMIVERVSGMSYYDYMKTNVLERAGMKTASFVTLPVPSDAYAIGYATPPGSSETADNSELVERTSSPAGGAYASAADIVAFSRALWSGTLVALPRVDEFTTGKVSMGPVKYGYGFGERFVNGWRSVGHNGGAPGVGAEFESFPEQGIDVVVLTNIDMPEATRVMALVVNAVSGGLAPATTAGAGSARLPDSPIGRRAAAFLDAFSAGKDGMTKFIAEQMMPADGAPAARAEMSMGMRERIGRVEFRSVLSAEQNKLVLLVSAEKVGPVKVTLEFEPQAPFRMMPRPDFNPYEGAGPAEAGRVGRPPELATTDARIAPARALIQQVLSGNRAAAESYLRAHAAAGYTADDIKRDLDAIMTRPSPTTFTHAGMRQGFRPGEV
ncbi:MAG: serine hydrolase domain-containing protein, partial [Gemmatimonadaceae bacterium]